MNATAACPVCSSAASLLDVVDLNKSCEEARGIFLPLAGTPIYYALCPACGFCFAPEMMTWTLAQFEQRIYNDAYVTVDPDYLDARPRANAANLMAMLGSRGRALQHLDYGGGGGLLATLLRADGWQSRSYDPFVDRELPIQALGRYELITAFEVFEHVPDVAALMAELQTLLAPGGLVLFSTLVNDGQIAPRQRLAWWYAAPRNGHISLFSRNSLALLGQRHGFNMGSFSEGLHLYFTAVPAWAMHLMG
jgi:SAM-dependent methyltransferase